MFEPYKYFTSSNSTRLHYHETGQGEKVVIFLHGFGLNLYSWSVFQKEPLNNHRFYFLDLKGFGFSDKPKKSDYSITEQASLIFEFLELKKIKKITLVGHSYGGIVCLGLSNEIFRKRTLNLIIEKMVLIDVPAYKEIQPKFVKILKNNFLSFIALKVIPTCFIINHTLKSTFYNFKSAQKEHFTRYNFFFRVKNIDNSMVEIAKQILPENILEIEDSLNKIEIQTLIIWGRHDKLVPLIFGEKLNNQLKNSKLEIIEHCGHVPHEEQPQLSESLILNFLRNGI